MKANRRTTGADRGVRASAGYSLVELMIGMFVSLIVGVAVYSIFNAMQKTGTSQKIYNELQTNCNFALDQMKNELMKAGYRIPSYKLAAGDPICAANPSDRRCVYDEAHPLNGVTQGSSTLSFEYFDDFARNEGPYASGYTNATAVTYELDVNGRLLRKFKRYDEAAKAYNSAETTQVLVSNVAALTFNYLTGNDVAWDGVNPMDIRTVRPTLICNASRPSPTTGRVAQITLTTEVRTRNVGVDTVPTDTQPPGPPSGLTAWDPGQCGTLNLRWNANTETDLAGYLLLYGNIASGSYTNRLTLGRAPGITGGYEYQTVTGLENNSMYYFAIQAYDKSGNIGPLSNQISGAPSPSVRSVGGQDDTTVTPDPPPAPTGLTATNGPNQVTLTWERSPVAGLQGYKLFRSEDSATFTPVDEVPAAGGNRIGDYLQTAFNADAVSYVDTGLEGCKSYYYKLVAIACDTTIPAASRLAASVTGFPLDNDRPPAPVIVARPGFRRIILTLTNPVRSGAAATKDFSYTKIYWSTTGTPTLDETTGVVTPNQGIPQYNINPVMPNLPSPLNGVFTGEGNSMGTVNFNDEVNAAATAPNLQADTTYFFRAVAYDRCGNSSTGTTSSVAMGTQCGDCFLPAPAPAGTPDPACYEAPPVPTNVQTAGCFGYVDLSWDPINDSIVRDLQGFRVVRREGASWVGGTNEVMLTGADAAWLTTFRDATALPGKTYSYRVMATDCYYEQHHGKPSTLWPEAGNDPNNNFSDTFKNDVAIGSITIDPTLAHPASGYLLPESAAARAALPLALQGIAPRYTISAADGLTSVPPTFQHNAVTLWIKNTAATNLTLRETTTTWERPAAYLYQVAFGDGLTTLVTREGWSAASSGPPRTSPAAVTMAANSRLLASDDKIPLVSLFKKLDGTVDQTVDARQQTMRYRLAFKNESTGTDGCSVESDLFFVPLGPFVYGTTQDQPAAGTRAWPVAGESGTNAPNTLTAGSAVPVNVFTNVFDSSNAGIAPTSVKLYYAVTDAQPLAPPLAATAEYPLLTPYIAINMVQVSGNTWRTPAGSGIPSNPGRNIWYFIVAIDNQGNFDRDPEIQDGAYQYYQQQADICTTIPGPPVLSGGTGVDRVTLTWTAPPKNTDASNYLDGKGYKVYRRQDGGAWLYLATINDKLTTTYVDIVGASITTSVYDYRVTAFDLCLPDARESVPSNYYTEIAEGPCGNTPAAPVLSGTTDSGNQRVNLSWTVPLLNTSGSPLTDLAGYRVWRRVNTEPWVIWGDFPAGTTSMTDWVWAISAQDFSYYVTAYDSCADPAPKYSPPSNVYTDTDTTNNPCDTWPGPPQSLVVASATAAGIRLTWSAPLTQQTPAGLPYNDPGGYRVYRGYCNEGGGNCTYEGVVSPNLAATATEWTDTDPSVLANMGVKAYLYYVIAFDTCNNEGWGGPVVENFSSVDACASAPTQPWLWVWPYDRTGATVHVGINPTGDLAGFEIQRGEGSTNPWAVPATWTTVQTIYGNTLEITWKDTVSDAGAKGYFYRARAFDTCATPLYSIWSSANAEWYDYCDPGSNPGPVTGLMITNQTASGITLSWTPPNPLPDDIQGYAVERSNNGGPWAQIGTSPLTSYTDGFGNPLTDPANAANPANVYSYRVRAYDLCATPNYGAYSGVFTETLTDPCLAIPAVPATPSIGITGVVPAGCNAGNSADAEQKVTISWTGPTPSSTLFYRVLKCSTDNATSAICTPATITPSYEPPGIQSSTLSYQEPKALIDPSDYRLWYWLEYVSYSASCGPSYWKTLRSDPVKDSCGP